MIKILLLGLVSTVLLSNQCNRHRTQKTEIHQTQNPSDTLSTLKKLYEKYANGEIEQCMYNGASVYIAGLNAYDAGSVIYDAGGNKIGSCNYGWGKPDSMCLELKNCETLYRVADNIWDKPAVDKYNLTR